MYKVSSAFRAALNDAARTDKISGKITLTSGVVINFTDKDIQGGSVKIDNQCVNGDELEFGAVYAGQLTMTLQTTADRYSMYNGKIEIYYGLQVAGGAYETVPMGVYWITEALRQGMYINITALDAMVNLNTNYDGVTTYGTPFDILAHYASATGVPFANTKEEIAAMPNGSAIFQVDSTCNVSTWLDCIAIIAQMIGGFATATRDGKFKICQFAKTPCLTISADRRFDTSIADYKSAYLGLRVIDKEGNLIESYGKTTGGLVMEISSNPLFDVGTLEHKQELADNIRIELCKIVYTPSDVTCSADPTIECGDELTYTVNGAPVDSVVSSYVWKYRGTQTLKAVGKNPYLTNAQNKADKSTASMRQEIAENRVVFEKYTNINEYTVTEEEQRIISMVVVSSKQSNAVFVAQILLDITQGTESKTSSGTSADGGTLVLHYANAVPCALLFKYYMNGEPDTVFTPETHYDEGRHIVTLFYQLPDMAENTTNRLIVTMAATTGSAHVDVGDIKASIIGNGLINGAGEWDGTIVITEKFGQYTIDNGVKMYSVTDGKATAAFDIPQPIGIAETVGTFDIINSTMDINAFTDSATAN